MSTLSESLAEHGGALFAAATCLLALGCIGMAFQRSPIHRQRAGELAILGVLFWLVLACVPLPRYSLSDFRSTGSVAANSLRPPEPIEDPLPVFEPFDGQILAEVTAEDVPPTPLDLLPPKIGTAGDDRIGAVPMVPEFQTSPAAAEPGASPGTEAVRPSPNQDHGTVPVDRASAAPAPPPFGVRYALSLAYLVGVVGCFVWLVLGRLLLVRMLWSASLPEPWLRQLYRRIPFARRHRPRVLISGGCTRAFSFGIWRPTIVLPGAACRPDRAGPLRDVLLHELAHAGQRDAWGHFLFNMAFPLLYFHPLYWWIRYRACLAAELIADDLAAEYTAKESYVETLIALVKQRGHRQLAYLSSPQIFGSRSQFYRRMKMLLDRNTRLALRCSPRWRLIYPTACLMAVVLVAGAAGVPPVQAQPALAAEDAPADEGLILPELIVEDVSTEVEVAVEEIVPSTVADEADEDAAQLKTQRDASLADRDQLRAQLKALEVSVSRLTEMVDLLKQQQGLSQRVVRGAGQTAHPAFQPEQAAAQVAPPTIHGVISGGHHVVGVKVELGASSTIRTISDLRPGDRVDAHTPSGMLPDLRVFAVMVDPAPGGPYTKFKSMTVSLGVSSAQAEKLIVASGQGKVVLHKRKAQPQPTMTPAAPTPTTVPESPSATVRKAAPTLTGRRADLSGPVAERWAPEGTRVDLVSLATTYADALGSRDIAGLRYENLKALAEKQAVSTQDVEIAKINLKTAERKVRLLRDIAASALRAAEMENASLRNQQKSWTEQSADPLAVQAIETQTVRARSRLEILKSILGSD